MRTVLILFVAACGSSDTCKSDEVEVDYLGGPRDGESHCVAAPAVCGNPATCEDTCRGAMYSLCESPYNGVGCSDTFAPPIISCNP